VSFTLVVPELMAFSAFMRQFQNCRARIFSTTHPMKPPYSFDSPQSWEVEVQPTPFEMFVDSPSSFTLARETGISLEITSQSSSFKMRLNSPTSFTLENLSPKLKFHRHNPPTTISGTFKDSRRKRLT
jgi:hypothetical protein